MVKDEHNSQILKRIAGEEQKQCQLWKEYTKAEVKPNRTGIGFFFWVARLFGLTFGIRLMELGEENVQKIYVKLVDFIPEAKQVLADEEKHEDELLEMLDEEGLKYAGSVVLGLNDALVELTGALAGFTFAFKDSQLIALAGLITGVSASFSMAASEYLSTKAEEGEQDPLRSAIYTGIAYLVTVFLLVIPFLILDNYLFSLMWTILNAIVLQNNYYISVAKGYNFAGGSEMASISLGVKISRLF